MIRIANLLICSLIFLTCGLAFAQNLPAGAGPGGERDNSRSAPPRCALVVCNDASDSAIWNSCQNSIVELQHRGWLVVTGNVQCTNGNPSDKKQVGNWDTILNLAHQGCHIPGTSPQQSAPVDLIIFDGHGGKSEDDTFIFSGCVSRANILELVRQAGNPDVILNTCYSSSCSIDTAPCYSFGDTPLDIEDGADLTEILADCLLHGVSLEQCQDLFLRSERVDCWPSPTDRDWRTGFQDPDKFCQERFGFLSKACQPESHGFNVQYEYFGRVPAKTLPVNDRDYLYCEENQSELCRERSIGTFPGEDWPPRDSLMATLSRYFEGRAERCCDIEQATFYRKNPVYKPYINCSLFNFNNYFRGNMFKPPLYPRCNTNPLDF